MLRRLFFQVKAHVKLWLRRRRQTKTKSTKQIFRLCYELFFKIALTILILHRAKWSLEMWPLKVSRRLTAGEELWQFGFVLAIIMFACYLLAYIVWFPEEPDQGRD